MKNLNQIQSNGKDDLPLVSIIIPHHQGLVLLVRCLESIKDLTYPNTETIIVDNGCSDGSVEAALLTYPWAKVVRYEKNYGYAGGCNAGIRVAKGKYLFILHNDAILTPQALTFLVQLAETSPQIAAVQPKVLSLESPEEFDYAGAGGGYIDRYGFNYCRGRLFNTVEADKSQYNDIRQVFWAGGAGFLLNREITEKCGLMDEDFFAYLVDIDLCWRFHLLGYLVLYCGKAKIYHQGGTDLWQVLVQKKYLSHRNSLVMMLKNASKRSLLFNFPIRFLLDLIAMVIMPLKGDFSRAKAIIRSYLWLLTHIQLIWRKRRIIKSIKTAEESEIDKFIFRGSIVFRYFIKKEKIFNESLYPLAAIHPYDYHQPTQTASSDKNSKFNIEVQNGL